MKTLMIQMKNSKPLKEKEEAGVTAILRRLWQEWILKYSKNWVLVKVLKKSLRIQRKC